jgi:hypothetical protein
MSEIIQSSIEKELETRGWLTFTFRGVSMMPLLRQGRDLVTIRTIDRRLAEKEVALYKRDSGQLVLHRVIEVYENGYGIRGDNTFGIEKVRDDQILGILTEVIRDGKTISVTDPAYLKYVDRNLRSYPARLAMRKCRRVLSKAKHTLLG